MAAPGASGASNPLPTDTVLSSNPNRTNTSVAGAQNPQQGTMEQNSTEPERRREKADNFLLTMQNSRSGCSHPPAAAPVAARPLPAAAAGVSLATVFEGATLHEVAPFLSAVDKKLLVPTTPGLMRD